MLALEFKVVWDKYITQFTLEGKPRKRSVAKERTNGILPTVEDILLFILYENKNYTIHGTIGAQFKMEQPHVRFWLKLLRPMLQQTLQNRKDLPVRCAVELNRVLAGRDKITIDGVERPVLRSSDNEAQTAQPQQPRNPAALEEYLKKRQAETELYKTTSPVLKPFYKQLVEQYWKGK
jgi:hypothetical protein